MNLLSLIIDRLNQRVAAYNLFDQIYGLSELNQNGNEKAWVNYIGDGQAQVVSDYDGANGTIFWAKRGRVSLSKNEQYNSVSCKQLYLTSIPLTAYAIVRKSSLPCDGADSVDFVANQIFKYVSGKDVDFRLATGLVQYDVIPSSYGEETRTISKNYEWACVTVDFNIEITSDSNDGCYAPCDNVPLPPYNPPVGTCCNIAIYDEGQIITESVTQIDFTGVGVTATSVGGAVTVTIIGEPAQWGTIGTGTGVSSQTDLVNYLLANFYPLLTNPSGFLVAADLIPYLTSVDAALTYYPIPTGTTTDYIRGDGSIAAFPSLTSGTVTDFIFTNGNGFTGTVTTSTTTPTLSLTIQTASASQDGQLSSTDWQLFNGKQNAITTGTTSQYFRGDLSLATFPTIPAAQIQSDWNQANNAALDFIKNKPTITSGTVTSVNAGTNISVTGTTTDPIINSLSDRYRTSSVTSNTVSNGAKTFIVDLNLSYIPLQEILIVYDPANHMHGEVTSYNPATGSLVVDIKNHTGSGTYTSWTINLDGTPVDAISGVGLANEIAYFTGAQVLSSLAAANNAILVTSGSGVPSISTTIPNGVIATTQSPSDNSTKIATTAYVDNAGIGNYNGKLSVTVASNNITVALKHLSGADPSAASPVYIIINGTLRTVTAALSITINAGTNWFGNGLNFETDYFAYLGYNATDGIVIGFSQIIGERYGNFSTTTTAWDYIAVSTTTNASANDAYVVIGRFAATLGVTASFNWSVPSYTPENLIQYPVYETRWIDYSNASTVVGWTSFTEKAYKYKILNGYFINSISLQGTSNSTSTSVTMPIIPSNNTVYHNRATNNGAVLAAARVSNATVNNVLGFFTDQSGAAWTGLGIKVVITTHILRYR